MNPAPLHDRRAVHAALLGLGLQLASALLFWGLGFWSGSAAVPPAAAFAFGGLLPWLCLLVTLQQQRLERLDALEAERLARQPGDLDGKLFEQSADDLSVARRRLRQLHQWVLPAAGLLSGLYLVGFGAYFLYRAWNAWNAPTAASAELPSPARIMALFGALTLLNFVVSRYLGGLAKVREWQLLHGGAGLLMGNALASGLLCVAFGLARFESLTLLRILPWVLPALLALLGLEFLFNLLLGVYRPRARGEFARPAFDSRLLGLLSEPESVAATLQEAINYQFGFEVTRSWFWRLLSKAFLPLLGFGAAVLLLVSCLVIVEPHQQALVTRFGRLVEREPLGPGAHLKWPWPIESAARYDFTPLRQIAVGSHGGLDEEHEHGHEHESILWTNKHAEKERLLIVAPPADLADFSGEGGTGLLTRKGGEQAGKAPSVSLAAAEIFVHFRVRDLAEYVRGHRDPERRFRDLVQRAVARRLLRRDIDTWLGQGRGRMGAVLRKQIQRAADEAKLGLEVLFVGTASLHPPQQTAESFHETLRARQERETAIEKARQKAVKILARTAGTVALADGLLERLAQLEELKQNGNDKKQIAARERGIERLIRNAGGEAAVALDQARAQRWTRENAARGKAERFLKLLQAYRQAPNLYRMRRYLQTLVKGLAKGRKFLLLAERKKLILRMDFKSPDLGLQGVNLTTKE